VLPQSRIRICYSEEIPLATLPPYRQVLYDKAEAERRLCRDWLSSIMRQTPKRSRTKADLCAEAMDRFKVSKNAFDAAWIMAIEETENHQWYELLRHSRRLPTSR
jgi:hypothetical protein